MYHLTVLEARSPKIQVLARLILSEGHEEDCLPHSLLLTVCWQCLVFPGFWCIILSSVFTFTWYIVFSLHVCLYPNSLSSKGSSHTGLGSTQSQCHFVKSKC